MMLDPLKLRVIALFASLISDQTLKRQLQIALIVAAEETLRERGEH
jgi:hypothetical protein